MQAVGMMLVDLDTNPLGLPAMLAHDLAGQPVLRRAVARALACESLTRVALLAPADQHSRIRELLAGLAGDRLVLAPLDRATAFGRLDSQRIRLTRLWAMSSWRGGISGATWFDELAAPEAMARLAAALGADAVALLCPAAALADAALIDAISRQFEKHRGRFHLALCQAPPGFASLFIDIPLLQSLGRAGVPLGSLLAYDPGNPRSDHAGSDAMLKIPVDVMACPHRFLADTPRDLLLLERIIRNLGDSPTAEQATRFVHALDAAKTPAWPREIDFELTTERPVRDTLRPTAPLRGPASDLLVQRVCDAIRRCPARDIAVTLGGHGDALRHPRVLEIAAALKQAGAMAVAVRTTGCDLTDDMVARLLDSAVDLVCVELDATSSAAYERIKGASAFDRVVGGMQRLLDERAARRQAGPLLVAEMIKCDATLDEMEGFFDRWRKCDEAHLTGLSHYGGRFLPAATGWPSCPPRRRPCLRIHRRFTILADGIVPLCDQDFAPSPSAVEFPDSLDILWQGDMLTRLRAAHHELKLDDWPLCQTCQEWHRP